MQLPLNIPNKRFLG